MWQAPNECEMHQIQSDKQTNALEVHQYSYGNVLLSLVKFPWWMHFEIVLELQIIQTTTKK